MNTIPSRSALITGASSGIGLYLAHEFARAGYDLWLVAIEPGPLEAAREALAREHGVAVRAQALDLAAEGAIDRLDAGRGGAAVEVLVNNAGHGQRGAFWEIDEATHLHVIRTNVEAVVRLTRRLLPGMLAGGRGGVLNVASIAGFEPGPQLAVYHASKAFVLSWSEALATELDGSGLTVTTLCPGPTDTDFFAKADMENSRAFQQANLMAPQDVARIGYEAFVRGERMVVAGGLNKTLVGMRRLLPERWQAAKNEKLYEDAPPQARTRTRGDKEGAARTGDGADGRG